MSETRIDLIGRDELLEQFEQLCRPFHREGAGQIWIGGEAGCGKSAFLQACGARAAQAGWEVLLGRCTEETIGNPYGPFLDMLGLCFDRNGRLINDRSVESIVDQISLDEVFDALQDIPGAKLVGFGIKIGLSIFETRRGQRDNQDLLNRNFEFILQVLEQIEKRRKKPLLLLIDDLHLAGATTYGLLDYILSRIQTRLLIVSTWPANGAANEVILPRRLASPEAVLNLSPLDEGHMRQIAHRQMAHLPDSLLNMLLDFSRGLPRLLTESLKLLEGQEEALLTAKRGAGRAGSPLHILIDRQLAGLSDTERALIECAAHLAEPIPLDVLTAPSLCAYLGTNERTTLVTLIALADRGTLLAWDGPQRLRFASSFLRQALRERTAALLAQRDHLRIGEAIEAVNGEEQAAQLAAHYLAARHWEKALHFALQNAEMLSRSVAYPEAIQSYEMALQALAQMPNTQTHEKMKYDILCSMSLVAEQSGDWNAALSHLEEALLLSKEDPARQAEIYAGLGWLRFQRGEIKTALELLDQSAALYHQLDDQQGLAQIDYYLGVIYSQQKEWQRATACFERFLATGEQVGFSEGRASAYIELGNLNRLQYRWAQAESLLQQGIELAQAEGNYVVLAQGYHYLGLCYSVQGKAEAIPTLHHALEIVRTRTKQPAQEARLQNTLAETLVRQNRWAEAEEAFRASARLKERLGDKAGLAITYGGLGRMYSRQWRFEEAVEYLQKDIDLLAEEFQVNVAWIQQWTNVIGEIRRLQGQLDLAERHFDRALALAGQIPDQEVRTRSIGFTHMFRANLALDRGDLPLAARECEQAYACLAGTWAEGELARTQARLARMNGDFEVAQTHLERALTAAERGEEIDRAQTWLEQAYLYRAWGNPTGMRDAAERVVALARRLQNRELERRAQTLLASIAELGAA